MDATIEGLRTLGLSGITARELASIGDFNQALTFYHYGSMDEALISAIGGLAERRMENHRDRLLQADSLVGLLAIARELHLEDRDSGEMTALVQAYAAGTGERDPLLGPKLHQSFTGWTELISDGVDSVLGQRFDDVMDGESIGLLISTLFVGIELIDNLDPTQGTADQMFAALTPMATLIDNLLTSPYADDLGRLMGQGV